MRRLLLALLLACASTNASATLMHTDWRTAGDHFVTIDTVSGLEWLSFSQTTIGHEQIRSELDTTYAGFRFATADELLGLFSTYVPVLPASGFMFGNDATIASQLQMVMDALGYDDDTFLWVNTCEFATGCDPLGFGAGNGIRRHNLSTNLTTANFQIWFNNDNTFAEIQALVRVSEPGTFVLFGVGIFALLLLSRSRVAARMSRG